MVRLALRLIVEEALEGEVADVLGRERCKRGEGGKAGSRNGYRTGKVKTADGAIEYSAPQVRDTPEPFASGAPAALSGRTRELERLAVELCARGLSTRGIEEAFADETGRRLLSRAAVSEITERLWAKYEGVSRARSLRARHRLSVRRRHRRRPIPSLAQPHRQTRGCRLNRNARLGPRRSLAMTFGRGGSRNFRNSSTERLSRSGISPATLSRPTARRCFHLTRFWPIDIYIYFAKHAHHLIGDFYGRA